MPILLHAGRKSSQSFRYERMNSLVGQMIALHKQLRVAKSEAEKTVIQRQIDWTDGEIDRIVYDLYGLTKTEIAIVESRG
jgi:hypothetical protein